MIDTHSHIYSSKFDSDREEMLERASSGGIEKIFMPNIDLASIEPMLAIEKAEPHWCHPMMGLHPCSVDGNYQSVLQEMESWLEKRPFSGIGESGIDLYWDKTYFNEQKEAMRIQAEWAKKYKLPLVLHIRDSMKETLELLVELKHPDLYGIVHCFTGTEDDAKLAINCNFKLGIGGVLTYKKSGLAESIKDIPLESLVLETDAPYLAPVPYRGKRNEPLYTTHIAQKLADVKELPVEKVIDRTSETALNLFKNHSYKVG